MKLFIVESPAKARTIAKLLGKDYVVRATLGHIKDLPTRGLGIEEDSLRPRYVFLKGKKKLIKEFKKLAHKSEKVYIGTDPDREGEAIAFFLYEELKKVNPNIKRVIFYEITHSALRESIEKAGDINMNLVHAQFARRILDRLIGYKLSPYLWKAFGDKRLSVGRVQSPALKLVVEREREIQSFKSKKYYYVKAVFEKEGQLFEAIYDYRYENPSDAKDVLKRMKEAIFVVKEVSKKGEHIPPPKPFITASLQSDGSEKLGLSPEHIQRLAQQLYESGYITYPRTDSFRMNLEKAKEFIRFIKSKFGNEYVGKLRKTKEKSTSQGAHECIRPVSLIEEIEREHLKGLYSLIFKRTLASLMADMVIERTELLIEANSPLLKRPVPLIARAVRVKFDGWSRVYPSNIKEDKLPYLKEGDLLKVVTLKLVEKKTQPPPRYTEGLLVKKLEKLNIGRPSTYSTIISTLKARKYVHLKSKRLVPSPIAFDVVDFLIEHFPLLMDYKFTARMEESLDRIEEGKEDWKETVRRLFSMVAQGGIEPPTPRFSAGCSTN